MSTVAGHEFPRSQPPVHAGHSIGPRPTAVRLAYLHLVSRRVPTALAELAGCAAALQIAARAAPASTSTASALLLPLVIETAATAIVIATTASPFGESERATGRWLPWLRLGSVAALAASAVGALVLGSLGMQLPGGALGVTRDLAGLLGIGLLCRALLGANLGWAAPTAYFIVAEYALAADATTPWAWPARPSHDIGAGLCAGLVFAFGMIALALPARYRHGGGQ